MLASLVYLVQTDTTVGFSSSSDEKLSLIKNRPNSQKILQTVNSFKTLKTKTRVPNKYKRIVRNSNNSTFIYPNTQSYRIINNENDFYNFIKKFKILYSTSANYTKKKFDLSFSIKSSDVIVYNKFDFSEKNSSSIYKISKQKLKKVR